MVNRKHHGVLLAYIALAVFALSCNLTAIFQTETIRELAPSEATVGSAANGTFPSESITISEPGGAVLTVEAGALNGRSEISIEDIGPGDPRPAGSPLAPATTRYRVNLGSAHQIGQITASIPLEIGGRPDPLDPDRVFMAWAEPVEGFASMVGVRAERNALRFPVVGSGNYEVYGIPSHEALLQSIAIFDPLAVPTYPQNTPAWCSPTAMTNLANFHQGSWPAGGLGARWGETSNWYLAGKAGQGSNDGEYFHTLMNSAGFPVPEDVTQEFSNEHSELIIWNWEARVTALDEDVIAGGPGISPAVNYEFAEDLFNSFQAYVESFVWGANGPRQPLAWGLELAWDVERAIGHSRIITGSSGNTFFWNDPSSGSLNQSASWREWYQEYVSKSLYRDPVQETGTLVFFKPPRPETERRGVIWLKPAEPGAFEGSVSQIAGDTGKPRTSWLWGGDQGHQYGFYFVDETGGQLPSDTVLGVQFKALNPDDQVQYGYEVVNISNQSLDFELKVQLLDEYLSVVDVVGDDNLSNVMAAGNENRPSAGSFDLAGLTPGLYTLKFELRQNDVLQDVKYVRFRVAQGGLTAPTTEPTAAPVATLIPGPIDNQPPTAEIAHSPVPAFENQEITFTAAASDNVAVARIEIWLAPPYSPMEMVLACSNTTICVHQGGPYEDGEGSYYAKAVDTSGNVTTTTLLNFQVHPQVR